MDYIDINSLQNLIIDDKNSFNFFYSSSNEFLKYLSCSLSSLLSNCDVFLSKEINIKYKNMPFNIFIFNDGNIFTKEKIKIGKFYKNKFKNIKLTIYFISIDNYDFENKIPDGRGLSFQTYYRLFAFHEKFINLKNCIFIDCDTIIANENFMDEFIRANDILYKSKKKIGVVQDVGIVDSCTKSLPMRSDEFDIKIQKFFDKRMCISIQDYLNKYLKINISDYFNAGIIIINHSSNNKNYFEELINSSLATKYPFVDQCVLNKILIDDKKFISLKWNLMPTYNFDKIKNNEFFKNNFIYTTSEISEALKNPIIIHYAGAEKPWNKNWMAGFKNVYYKNFIYYLDICPSQYKYAIKREIINSKFKIRMRSFIIRCIKIFIKSYGE